MGDFGQRISGELGQLLLLEVMLEADPFGPGVAQFAAEHLFELGGVKRLATLVAAEPLDNLVGAIFERQPRVEAGAVEIIVDPDLEVDRRALRFEAERRVEAVVVADLGAEHHFVIGALRAAEPARHPGFKEYCRAFKIPARDDVARGGEIIPQDRFGMFLQRHRLAGEETAPVSVLAVPHVHRRDMRELVVG